MPARRTIAHRSVRKVKPMRPSSILCRAQEARQHAVAAGSTLSNVRGVAKLAAAAWGKEAVLAEGRERRMLRRQAMNENSMELSAESPHAEDLSFSENPDRGFSDMEMHFQ